MDYKKFLKNKTILVTGGTGSLGNNVVKELIQYRPRKIIIVSRDEDKQFHMGNLFSRYPFIKFELGDIRDRERMEEVTKNVDILIHAAALKHIHFSEKEPLEYIKTNILGTKNVIDASIKNGIPVVVAIGTDKAVKPVNAYGMTKALQEKLIISANARQSKTRFIGVRYGNVISSRGSVIPFFKEKISKKEPLPVTDPSMTRYLLKLKEAVDLILYAIQNGKGGEIFVKKMPAATVLDIAKALTISLTKNPDYPIKIVGIRPGEKIHEVLVSEEEMHRAIEFKNHYIIYGHGKLKKPRLLNKDILEYSSQNTIQLNQKQVIDLLKNAGQI